MKSVSKSISNINKNIWKSFKKWNVIPKSKIVSYDVSTCILKLKKFKSITYTDIIYTYQNCCTKIDLKFKIQQTQTGI